PWYRDFLNLYNRGRGYLTPEWADIRATRSRLISRGDWFHLVCLTHRGQANQMLVTLPSGAAGETINDGEPESNKPFRERINLNFNRHYS
ncbi:MAG TPA: hypothetical protein PK231_13625, partial [Acidocella sp.]|nr:hypothetical protein [Acidocella sp.]